MFLWPAFNYVGIQQCNSYSLVKYQTAKLFEHFEGIESPNFNKVLHLVLLKMHTSHTIDEVVNVMAQLLERINIIDGFFLFFFKLHFKKIS